MTEKYYSTTALSKEMQLSVKEVFSILETNGLVIREENNWVLTQQGKNKGGTIKNHPRYGNYIAWMESIKSDPMFDSKNPENKILTATTVGNHFGITKFRINPILSELGLVQKGIKGWHVTELGKNLGGIQFEYDKTGIPYVCWSEGILNNKRINEFIKEIKGESIQVEQSNKDETSILGFRDKFEAKHRAADGHYVRSKAEMLIDNWLYMSEIVHAY